MVTLKLYAQHSFTPKSAKKQNSRKIPNFYFVKILKARYYHEKVLSKRFYFNHDTTEFCSQT